VCGCMHHHILILILLIVYVAGRSTRVGSTISLFTFLSARLCTFSIVDVIAIERTQILIQSQNRTEIFP